MSIATRICSACKFENHASADFCISCGRGLSDPVDQTAVAGGAEPQPHASPEQPQTSTEALIRKIADESGFEQVQTRAGVRMTIPLGENRTQKVHVVFSGHDDEGHDIVSFISICGKAEDRYAMSLLRFNNKLTYGSFALKTIQGTEYFVVTANQLAGTADVEELRKKLFEVAQRADAVENLISKGKDVF